MNKHEHQKECKHAELKYCEQCKTVYCVECGKEWVQNTFYIGTSPWWYPTIPSVEPYKITCTDSSSWVYYGTVTG